MTGWLVDCDSEFEEFVKTMDILGLKLGPMVFQFPLFDRWKFPKQDGFLAVLSPFLKKNFSADHKYVVEIRNKTWLDARFADVLRQHNVALALTDTSFIAETVGDEGTVRSGYSGLHLRSMAWRPQTN